MERSETAERAVAAGRAALFCATGPRPLVRVASFEAVTGPRRERWLVRAVGVRVASGAAWAVFARRGARREGER